MPPLKPRGMTYDQYKSQIREQMERVRLMGEEVRSKIHVTEKEIKAYYDATMRKVTVKRCFRPGTSSFHDPCNATEGSDEKTRNGESSP